VLGAIGSAVVLHRPAAAEASQLEFSLQRHDDSYRQTASSRRSTFVRGSIALYRGFSTVLIVTEQTVGDADIRSLW